MTELQTYRPLCFGDVVAIVLEDPATPLNLTEKGNVRMHLSGRHELRPSKQHEVFEGFEWCVNLQSFLCY
jgi:hypothetical protein